MPLDQEVPWYEFSVTLEQVTYTFEISYNSRAARWRMSILDSAANPVLMGVPLMVNRDLTGPYHYLSIPPGGFCVLDASGTSTEATLSSFLLDHTLYYLESA